jgi:predicted site-specific integrase-resolvase
MSYVTIDGKDYVHIDMACESLNVCRATFYNWRRAGHIEFAYPLGRALTFLSRETIETLMRLKITAAMGAFVKDMEISN